MVPAAVSLLLVPPSLSVLPAVGHPLTAGPPPTPKNASEERRNPAPAGNDVVSWFIA